MSEILEVMAYASVGAALGEALSWLLVYRKPEFERLTQQIDAQQKKIDKQMEKEVAAPASKSKQKKVGRDEKEMGKMSRDLAVLRMRQQLVTAVLHVLAFAWFATHYDGRPLARLPFVPLGSCLKKLILPRTTMKSSAPTSPSRTTYSPCS